MRCSKFARRISAGIAASGMLFSSPTGWAQGIRIQQQPQLSGQQGTVPQGGTGTSQPAQSYPGLFDSPAPTAQQQQQMPHLVIPPANPPYWKRYFGPTTGPNGPISFALPNRTIYTTMPPGNGYGYGYGYGFAGYPAFPGYDPLFGGSWPYFYGAAYMGLPLPYLYNYWSPYANPVLQGTLIENQYRWGAPIPPAGAGPPFGARTVPKKSSPAQQAKSIHAQAQGDVWLRKQKFLNAYERYKYAISAATERPEPYFRLGYALTAIGSFDSAVKYFKQGIALDRQWPAHGEQLNAIFGDDNRLTVLSVIERTAIWVKEDIRDPDRLFLMGILLHFDGDTRANQFFEAAYRLAGYGDHLLVFLQSNTNTNGVAGNGAGRPAGQMQNPAIGASPPAPMEPPIPVGQPLAGAANNVSSKTSQTNAGPSSVKAPAKSSATGAVPSLRSLFDPASPSGQAKAPNAPEQAESSRNLHLPPMPEPQYKSPPADSEGPVLAPPSNATQGGESSTP